MTAISRRNWLKIMGAGAVCGSWWNGPNGEGDCLEGYAVIDLYDDGSFDHAYIPYGWQARA